MDTDFNGNAGDEWAEVHELLTSELAEEGVTDLTIVEALEIAERGYRLRLEAETELELLKDDMARVKEGDVIEGRLTSEQNLQVDNALYENNSFTKGNDDARNLWVHVVGSHQRREEMMRSLPYYEVSRYFFDDRSEPQTLWEAIREVCIITKQALMSMISR